MSKKQSDKIQLFERIVLIVFFCGPLIDILTAFTSKLPVTPGIIMRALFIVFAIYYLIFLDKTRFKLNLFLLIAPLVCLIATSIVNFDFLKTLNTNFLGYTFKFIFLYVGLLYFSSFIKSQKKFDTYLFRIPFCIIIISFTLATITQTAFRTYDTWGDGYSGWFSSPNELGALLCCIFPFSLYNAFKPCTKKYARLLDVSLLVCLSLIMLTIGTKAPLIGFFAISSAYLLYRILTIKTNHFQPSIVVLPTLMIIAIAIWSHLPAVINTNIRLNKIEAPTSAINNIPQSEPNNNKPNPELLETSKQNQVSKQIILNGRDKLEDQLDFARDNDTDTNPLAVFLFGKFYTSDSTFLITERDFHDIYILFGFLGLLSIILLLLPQITLSTINFFFTIKKSTNHFRFIVLLSIGVTLGVAFIGGHTLLSPSVSSFFAISFSLLLFCQPAPSKKTIAFVASAGGHLTQLTTLQPIFSDYNSCIITEKTPISLNYPVPVEYVLYCSRKQPVSYTFKGIVNILYDFILFGKINPDVVITTGVHTAVPFCIYGWLFRRKVIYIESFAKQSSPTITGKIVYPFVDVFIVQWKSMLKFYPKAKYFGGIY